MDDTQRMTRLATRAKIARMNGDDDEGDRLAAEAIRISDLATLRAAGIEPMSRDEMVSHLDGLTQEQHAEGIAAARERMAQRREARRQRAQSAADRLRSEFDVLKGHPDHSGLSHA